MKRLSVSLAAVAALSLVPAEAFPCGALVPVESSSTTTQSNASAEAQRAFIQIGPDTTKLHVQLTAKSSAEDFAWVLPVPKDAKLGVADPSLFTELDDETAPKVKVTRKTTTHESSSSEGGGGAGCGSAPRAGGAEDLSTPDAGARASNRVDHFGGGKIGNYQYDVIGSKDAKVVEDWLSNNGYSVPSDLAEAIKPYTDNGMAIAGVKLSGKADQQQNPDPLTIESSTPGNEEIVYPLKMSSLSAPETTPVVLYVAGPTRYQVKGFKNSVLDDVAEQMGDQVRNGNDEHYDTAVDSLSDSKPVAVTEYARDVDGNGCFTASCPKAVEDNLEKDSPFLTRLYMRIPKGDLQDVQLTKSSSTDAVEPTASVTVDLTTASNELTSGLTAAALPFSLVLFALFGLRRRQ